MDEKDIIKVPYELMDTPSVYSYKLSDKISPYIYRKNITPNMITMFRGLLGLFAYSLLNKNKLLAAILIVLFHFLDCLDGHHARKNNMVTKFGDYFDHIVDITFGIALIIYLYPRVDLKRKIVGGVILSFLMVYVGCEQKYIKLNKKTKVNNDQSLEMVEHFCPVNSIYNVDKALRITKMFSIGAFMFFLATSVYNSK
jgi:phosphatidylglycerophosphate synthase